jgi:hypothetical protein
MDVGFFRLEMALPNIFNRRGFNPLFANIYATEPGWCIENPENLPSVVASLL